MIKYVHNGHCYDRAQYRKIDKNWYSSVITIDENFLQILKQVPTSLLFVVVVVT